MFKASCRTRQGGATGSQCRAAQALEVLTKLANLCVAGYLLNELQEYFYSRRLVPLNKKDDGIRPIVVGWREEALPRHRTVGALVPERRQPGLLQ